MDEWKELGEEAKTLEQSQLPVKLIVRGRGFEISTEGSLASISKELDALANFAGQVAEKIGVVEEIREAELEPMPSAEEVALTPSANIPVIKTSRKTMQNLESLFDTPWGKTPRYLAEVMKALEVNAVPDKTSIVSLYLSRLVERGKLRRLEKEGKWAYFRIPAEE